MATSTALRFITDRYVCVVLLACVACGSPQPAQPGIRVSIERDGIVVLPDSTAPVILGQCTRGGVPTPSGFWTPSEQDLDGLDSLVVRRLERDLTKRFHPGAPMSERAHSFKWSFRVQVVGVVVAGRRVLYLNGFLAGIGSTGTDSSSWRRRPVIVCDGGEGLFGAVYDPQKRVLRNLEFNGY